MSVHRIDLPEALANASLDELAAALDRAAEDRAARVWVLAGGPGVFCRGMDLEPIVTGAGDSTRGARAFAGCLSRLRRAPRPTIAVVEGEALGGGVGLAAACDRVIAAPGATFALPEALFGLLPAMVMPVLLERMPPQKARLLALTGAGRSAAWAREHGLVDDVVPAEQLDRSVARAARELSRAGGRAVTGLRAWLAELEGLEPDAALARGAAFTADLARDPAVRGAARAFLEDGALPWEAR
ncbi:MAG: enoyl-CoA hydratase/isomerase family protein [Polyangiaceae bacterium]|nr:enoyl-CoA hydratase/isomerase family protein [Polyangiaceae bacterium]